jgi:hypothetical protein
MNNQSNQSGIAEEILKALETIEAVPLYRIHESPDEVIRAYWQIERNRHAWLRSLLEDNEKLRKERDAKLAFISKGNDEDMYWLQGENIRLSSELAAKDKVLEEVATKTHGSAIKARSILSQYRGTHETTT